MNENIQGGMTLVNNQMSKFVADMTGEKGDDDDHYEQNGEQIGGN